MRPRVVPMPRGPASCPHPVVARAGNAAQKGRAWMHRQPGAGFTTTAAADESNKRSAAASTGRWTAAIFSACVGVYVVDRYSLTDDIPGKQPAADDTKPAHNQTDDSVLTDVQTLALGYGVLCTSAIVGWRFWRSLRPVGSYLSDVRASPNGFLHWKGGPPKMFSINNALGRTFLGTASGGSLLLVATLADGRADEDD